MKLTPQKNSFSKRLSASTSTLYSGSCCCCCCILAPIGSYITEKTINKKVPTRGRLWRHVFVNFVIGAIAWLLSFYAANSLGSFSFSVIAIFTIMYLLFYAYSFTWFDMRNVTQSRWKLVFAETFLTSFLGVALSLLSAVIFSLFI